MKSKDFPVLFLSSAGQHPRKMQDWPGLASPSRDWGELPLA